MSKSHDEGSLVLKNAMVVNGRGTPPYGPVDILVEDGVIKEVVNVDSISLARYAPKRPRGDVEVDAQGMYVLPGLVDMHVHINILDEKCGPRGAEYAYKLLLAHGVTTIRTCGFGTDEKLLEHKRLSQEHRLDAPNLRVMGSWPSEASTVEEAREAVARLKELGVDGVKMIPRPHVTPSMLEAVAEEVRRFGFKAGVAIHHPQYSELDALTTSNALGELLTVEHSYGIPQAAIPGTQWFPPEYNYSNEVDRFRWSGYIWDEAMEYPDRVRTVVDTLIANGTTWDPTMVVYEAHRDLERAKNLPWHRKYTVRQLWEAFSPSPDRHATHFFNWTTWDEVAWRRKYRVWMQWVKYFFDHGGRLVAGSDTAFLYAVFGFALVRELELFQEAGIHPIDVVKIATTNAHEALGDPSRARGVAVGAPADLCVVDGNPLANFKVMYGTGLPEYGEDGSIRRHRGGVRWTVKGGRLYDCRSLLAEVAEYVESQGPKEGL